MFALDVPVLDCGPILDCPAGPSSFTAEAHASGFDATACDILYDLPLDSLFEKCRKDISHVFEKFDEVSHLYAWKYYKDREDVVAHRNRALKLFKDDFPHGLAEGRYVRAELPRLPFADGKFSLVLSGHFLFLYGDRLDFDFHIACLKEFLRVSTGEVRVFPLLGLDSKPYRHLEDVISFFNSDGLRCGVVEVPLEFQIGGNRMLRISRKR
jgi:hypothetical protein